MLTFVKQLSTPVRFIQRRIINTQTNRTNRTRRSSLAQNAFTSAALKDYLNINQTSPSSTTLESLSLKDANVGCTQRLGWHGPNVRTDWTCMVPRCYGGRGKGPHTLKDELSIATGGYKTPAGDHYSLCKSRTMNAFVLQLAKRFAAL